MNERALILRLQGMDLRPRKRPLDKIEKGKANERKPAPAFEKALDRRLCIPSNP